MKYVVISSTTKAKSTIFNIYYSFLLIETKSFTKCYICNICLHVLVNNENDPSEFCNRMKQIYKFREDFSHYILKLFFSAVGVFRFN